jgi:enoyl-CoA hydratase
MHRAFTDNDALATSITLGTKQPRATTVSYTTLEATIGPPVAHIHLNRPALANRFDALAHVELAAALSEVGEHAATRVVVLSAAGKVFSGGGDLGEILVGHSSEAVRQRMMSQARTVYYGLLDSPVPIVAAVQGAAIGLGATIVSMCDFSVAARDARIADPHVEVGLVAGDGGVIGWAQSMGVNRARRFLLTGDALSATRACELGLIGEVVDEPAQVLPRAIAIAEHIASLPPMAVRGTRRAFAALTRQYGVVPFEAGLAWEMESMAHPDTAERVGRFRSR